MYTLWIVQCMNCPVQSNYQFVQQNMIGCVLHGIFVLCIKYGHVIATNVLHCMLLL